MAYGLNLVVIIASQLTVVGVILNQPTGSGLHSLEKEASQRKKNSSRQVLADGIKTKLTGESDQEG